MLAYWANNVNHPVWPGVMHMHVGDIGGLRAPEQAPAGGVHGYARRNALGQDRAAAAPPGYAWLLDVVLGGAPAVTWAAAGELPPGFDRTEQLAVLPAIAGRSLLVSVRSRRGASSAMTSYNALRSPRSRLARRVVGAGLRTGLAQLLLPGKIDVGRAVSAPGGHLADVLLTEHLSELFGCGPVVVAISGGEGLYRKPILQVFSADGTPLGFVKVGWNDWTRDAVRREAAGLRACADGATDRLGAPVLLRHDEWHGLELLITAPIPAGVRRIAVRSPLPDVEVLREISRLSEPHAGELATSPWWLGLHSRIARVADPATRAELDAMTSRVEDAGGHARLEFGTWHGDFVPWNLAWVGSRLYAWDWESSAAQAPVGFDALHFYFQVAFVARQLPLEEAALAALKAAPALSALGVAAAAHRLVAALHLLELYVSHEVARGETSRADDRFHPAVTGVLDRLLGEPSGAGRPHFSGRYT